MTDVRLIRATLEHYEPLYQLCQFYEYDFSEFLPAEVGNDGHFHYIDARRYLTTPGFSAWLALSAGRFCGFVMLTKMLEQRRDPGRYLAEFFVMKRYRRQGIGRLMAIKTFDLYRGWWEIAEVGTNTPAQTFWRKVIGEYSDGRYEEFTTQDGDGMTIVWQTFNSALW